jgi:predicted N-acyltransferase
LAFPKIATANHVMPYSCELQSSIDTTDLAAWNALRQSDDPFTDPRFLRAVEHGLAHVADYTTALVRDETGRPMASACLCVAPLDLALLAGDAVKRLAGVVRRVLPNALRYNAVFCGLPVSAGQNQLRFAREADHAQVLQVLDRTMRDMAQRARARFIILKEFDAAAAERLTALTALGYYHGDSPPMNHLAPSFASFEQYLAVLKAPYRSKIVRSQRKFVAAGLRVEVLNEGDVIAERFTDEAYRMYRTVVDKSSVRLETLSLEWFREMARQFKSESVWLALYQGDCLLAYAYGLLAGGTYYSLFGGVDYAANADTDAYFNLMYHELDFALRQNVKDIQLGQTADDFKSRLGCYQRPLSFFVKPLRWKAAAALRLAPDWALPKYPQAEERHVFQTGSRP